MNGVRLTLGSLVLAAAALGGCLLVDGFGNYDLDGGPADAAADVARRDAAGDATRDATRDVARDRATADAPREAGCDTDSDPLNCGQCGHDCFGGRCTAGACEPVRLMEGLLSPRSIAVSSAGVYVSEGVPDSSVYLWRPEAGSSDAVALVASHQDLPFSVATSDTQVFWTTGSGVRTCPLGQAPCDAGLFETDAAATEIDVGPTAVCWTSSAPGTLTCAPLDGGPSAALTGLPNPAGLKVSKTSVLLANLGKGGDGGSLSQGPLAPLSAPFTFAAGQVLPQKVIFHPTLKNTVYWTDLGPLGDGGVSVVSPGFVMASNTDIGFAPVQIAAVKRPVGIVADDRFVYFVSSVKNGVVYSCPSMTIDPGCSQTILAEGQEGPTGLAEDPTSLYWTNFGGGTVMRLAKPPR